MSRPRRGSDSVFMIISLAFAGLVALVLGPIFLLFFVPIIGYYVWRLNGKARELEQRLAALENPPDPQKEPETPVSEQAEPAPDAGTS